MKASKIKMKPSKIKSFFYFLIFLGRENAAFPFFEIFLGNRVKNILCFLFDSRNFFLIQKIHLKLVFDI